MKPEQPTISLKDYLSQLRQRRWTVAAILIGGTTLAIGIALLTPRRYQAVTTFLPPAQSINGINAAINQLGPLSSAVGLAAKQTDELYASLLTANQVKDQLVRKFDLKKEFGTNTQDETRTILASRTAINTDKKTGIISVTYEDEDSQQAAEIANSYVSELIRLTDSLALTEAQRRRVFYEEQLKKSKYKLQELEGAYKKSALKSGISVTEIDFQQAIKENSEIKSQIAVKEIQLATARRFMTDATPEVARLAAEIDVLKRKYEAREIADPSDFDSDQRVRSSVALFKDFKIQSATVEILARQLELARIEEGKDGPLIQTIDKATPPELPTKPNRRLIVVTGFLISAFAAFLYLLLRALQSMQVARS